MDKTLFVKGMAVLSGVFPGLAIQPDLFYGLMGDLNGHFFVKAVERVCKEVTEIYPGTNIVAVIRKAHDEISLEDMRKRREAKALTYEEPDYEKVAEARAGWQKLKKDLEDGIHPTKES
jgi:hypothetical protein